MRHRSWGAGLVLAAGLTVTVVVTGGAVGAEDPLRGADASSLDRLEVRGVAYRTDEAPRAALGILEEAGFDVLRLQVLVDPSTGFGSLPRSAAMGARIRGAGFLLFLELRCADALDGPTARDLPRRWKRVPPAELPATLRTYVRNAVETFRGAGAMPDFVQVGADVGRGFLGDAGRIGPDSSAAAWDRWARLVGAGLDAARSAAPRARTVLGLEGGDPVRCAAVVDSLHARGVTFDLVGLVWLPWFHGTIMELAETLRLVGERVDGGVLVLETAYPWTLRGFDDTLDEVGQPSQLHPGYEATPEGQRTWFEDVITIVRDAPGGRGVFWGDAFSIPAKGVGSSRENLALFDETGLALPALTAGWKAGE